MLTIDEFATQTAVSASALRYYDELGLVRPVAREGGRRRYATTAVQQVGVVLLLRDGGFTLTEIARLLTDHPRRKSTWTQLAQAKINELDRLIADAETARTALAHSLECPSGDPASCPVFGRLSTPG